MKNFFLIFLIPFLAPSCSLKNDQKVSSFSSEFVEEKAQYEYSEINDLKISWNSMFFPAKTHYFIYFYSLSCAHCNSMKNAIIEYGLTHENIYFCEADETHKIGDKTEQTIGAKTVGDFWILGYPSLAKIEAKTVTLNVAGTSSIYSVLNI